MTALFWFRRVRSGFACLHLSGKAPDADIAIMARSRALGVLSAKDDG